MELRKDKKKGKGKAVLGCWDAGCWMESEKGTEKGEKEKERGKLY